MKKTIKTKYRPSPKQLAFHYSTYQYRLLLAGIGFGKTLAGIHECIRLSVVNKGFNGCIIAPTFPMFRDNILPLWKEFIPGNIYTHSARDNSFTLWTGQKIFVRTCVEPEHIRGLNIAWAWMDEAAIVNSDDTWKITQGRIGRVKGIPFASIFVTTTPKGYNWLIKAFKHGDQDLYKIITAKSFENPFQPRSFYDNLKEEYGEEWAAQELDAEVLESTGLCWDIQKQVHCNFDMEDIRRAGGFKYVVAGVDWGWSDPTSIIVAGKGLDGRWYVLEEWYKKGKLPQDIYAAMTDLKFRWNIKHFWADSSEPARIAEANAYNGSGAQYTLDANARNLRVVGVKKGANSVLAGINEVRQKLSVRSDGKPLIYIHERCKFLLREAENYYFGEDDKPEGHDGDHACDALRYIIHSEENVPRIIGVG